MDGAGEPFAFERANQGHGAYRSSTSGSIDGVRRTVYALLSCPREYPEWWGEAFLEGEGDSGPAAPGKRARLLTRGRLPYTLTWELDCVEAIAPSRLDSRIEGDFVGRGIWTITPLDDGACKVVLEWNVEVRKAARPPPDARAAAGFRWNHSWAMKRGEARMQR